MMTVHEVSKISGVSIRALHHYDKIGLLPATKVTDAGYRLYDDTALEKRIEDVRGIVMQQMSENMDNYIWTKIRDLRQLEQIRMDAMELFLNDYEEIYS